MAFAPDSYHTQHWQCGFFDRTSLHSIGLVCYLGHDGAQCSIKSSLYNIIIVDMNGWHKVRVGFCTCDSNIPWGECYRQLLQMGWYPASFDRPQTAFSFDLLETYHKITLQGKLNLYDFYIAIMQKTDNQGQSKDIVRRLSCFVLNVPNSPLESISPNFALCSAVETSQRRQRRRWRTSNSRPFCNDARRICN